MNLFKKSILNLYDKILISRMKKNEMNKFKDTRRVAIYEKYKMTDVQEKQVNRLYEKNYGKKIPLTWHRHYSAFSGRFDSKYFPELMYIPEFEHYMLTQKEYAKVLGDKGFLATFAKGVGVKSPSVFLRKENGFCIDSNGMVLTQDQFANKMDSIGDCFIKPSIDSCSGEGCSLCNLEDGVDKVSGKTVEQILDFYSDNFLVQECITCNEEIRKIYPDSVNTFRIITYLWNGEVKHTPSIMRIGQGGAHVDNAHAGGMFIGIDDNGHLKDKAYTEFCKVYEKHPDSGLEFKGYKISDFHKVIDAAEKLHVACPRIGVVNWDFTIDDENTPVLIEANLNGGSIWMTEMANGCGAFGDDTADILKWLRENNQKSWTWRRENIKFGDI